MTRLVCVIATAGVLLAAQPVAQSGPIIRWQPTNGPLGGEADSIIVHAGQLIVPLHNAGAWRSRDRGKSWRLVTERFKESWGMTKAGSDLFVFKDHGLHRFADLGAPWVTCGAVPRPPGTYGRLIDAGPALFYFVMNVGLFRSRDRCATWTLVAMPWKETFSAADIVFSSRAMIVSTWRGAFRTSDDGDTWEPVAKIPSRVSTSVVDKTGGVLIGTSNGLYRSTDDGISWTHLGFTGHWVGQLMMTPRGEIYAAVDKGSDQPYQTTMMRSADNGATWIAADEGLSGHSIRGLALDESGTLYAAGVTGVYQWQPAAGKWQHTGLRTLVGTSLFGAPWGDVYAIGDSGTYRTIDNGVYWRPLLLPDGAGHAVTVTRAGNLLMGVSDWIYRSSDRGQSWEQTGLNQSVSSLFTVPSTGVIFAGTADGLFRSTDNGATWLERSVGLRSFNVTSFGASPDGAIFAGTIAGEGSGEVYRSVDNGDHWRVLAPDSLEGVVNALAVVANGNVLAGTGQGIFRWAPTRREWQQLFGRSRGTEVSSLVVDADGRVIAGTTRAGVFVSQDGGDTWIAANFGLPTLRIRALSVAADGDLYAAAGPADWEFYATGRAANLGVRGIFKGRFVSRGR